MPVPDIVWDMVAAVPDGPLCPGPNGTPYLPYGTARGRLDALTEAMGITGYTSTACGTSSPPRPWDGANIANIAAILGHRTAETTLRVYVHPTQDAEARMRALMNTRWTGKRQLTAAA